MTPLDAAEAGFWARVSEDADLAAIVGRDATGKARVYPAAPLDTLEAGELSRMTYLAREAPVGTGRAYVTVLVDMYADPGAPDPDAILSGMDARLIALIDGQTWRHEGARLHGDCFGPGTGGRSWPAVRGRPLRRTRTVRILVS